MSATSFSVLYCHKMCNVLATWGMLQAQSATGHTSTGGTSVSHVFCTASTRSHVCKRFNPWAHLKLPLMPQVSSAPHFLLRLGYVIVSFLSNCRAKSSEHVVCGSVLMHSGPAMLFCAVVSAVAQPLPLIFFFFLNAFHLIHLQKHTAVPDDRDNCKTFWVEISVLH